MESELEDTVRYLHAGVLSRSPCFSEGLAQALGDVVEHQSLNQRDHFFPSTQSQMGENETGWQHGQ